MAQWLEALVLVGDPGSVLSTHTEWLLTTCDSSFRRSDAFFRPSQAPSMHMVNIYECKRHIHTYTHKETIFKKLFKNLERLINQG